MNSTINKYSTYNQQRHFALRISCLVLLLSPWQLQAQSLSIEQLWQQADKQIGAQQSALHISAKQQELASVQLERLPLIYGDANIQRNLIIPSTPVPAIAFDPNAAPGDIIPLQFATKWTAKGGIQLEWNVFDPARSSTAATRKLAIEKATVEGLQQEDRWKRASALAYAAVVLATEQLLLSTTDTALYAEILSLTQERHLAGRATAHEYLLAQQELEHKRIAWHESWSVLMESNASLQQYIDTEPYTQLSSSIEEIARYAAMLQQQPYDITLLEMDVAVNNQLLRGLKRQHLPSLKLNAYYGAQYFENNLQVAGPENWFGNSYVNLNLRIPLSAYFFSNPEVRKAQYDRQHINLQIQDRQRDLDIQQQQKSAKVIAAQYKIKSLTHILDLSTAYDRVLQDQYLSGKVLLTEVNKAHSATTLAQHDLWQAKYSLIELLLDQQQL